MALYKRPRSPHWQFDVTVGGKRYRGSTRCDSKTAAKAFEARFVIDTQERGFAPKPERKSSTLLAYIPTFEKWAGGSHQLKESSKRYYRDGITILKRSTLAHVPINSIHEDLIDTTVFTDLEGNAASAHLSNQALATLRRLLNKAHRWGDLREAPRVKLREASGRSAVITPEIEQRLLAMLQRPEKHGAVSAAREAVVDIYLLMHDGGMRTSEAVSARIEHIDWKNKRLFNPNGKSKRARRWIPLSDRLVTRLEFRCLNREQGWVFPSKRSPAGHLKAPWGSFRRACRDAGLPDNILLYTGRHTFGTAMMQATGNVFAVSEAMGHQDIKSMRPYQHHDPSELGAAVNQIVGTRHTLRHTSPTVQ